MQGGGLQFLEMAGGVGLGNLLLLVASGGLSGSPECLELGYRGISISRVLFLIVFFDRILLYLK